MTHRELAKKFVNGSTTGISSNMFIEGDSIYSYGHHFKIAQRYHGYFLINSNRYSITTSKQQYQVRNAIPDDKIILSPDCKSSMSYLADQMEKLSKKQLTARKHDYTPDIIKYNKMLENLINTM